MVCSLGNEKMVQTNDKNILEFQKFLVNQGFTTKTIRCHINNVSFFINDYLFYSEYKSFEESNSYINDFFTWACCKDLCFSFDVAKGVAASLRKYYKYMNSVGIINRDYLSSALVNINFAMEEFDENINRNLDNLIRNI